jgi:hypothetical protein
MVVWLVPVNHLYRHGSNTSIAVLQRASEMVRRWTKNGADRSQKSRRKKVPLVAGL